MKLSQRATRAYVGEVLAKRGEGRAVRLTAPRIAARLRGFRERVSDGAWQRRALTVLKKGDAAEVEAVRGEVEAVREWAEGFLSKFTTKP